MVGSNTNTNDCAVLEEVLKVCVVVELYLPT